MRGTDPMTETMTNAHRSDCRGGGSRRPCSNNGMNVLMGSPDAATPAEAGRHTCFNTWI